ncbi:hypothetical protein Aeqsu_2477 [Aequorivita sublithincola DSM 14238]|uniref:Uncharacterized protein n=1 Tax=Aequorivita sublithincola (strain DSM 14238 / LMG 21431 / ACAM 643 / 9-3) TaxID=746697 RepID=I3YY66_AEQSU|nr:hypothetical protein [Aequorivita sublithincola]AFL81934.1 hypothetical protein Aeqsu_2477 [Aequorivita sublithincola DSM 14238]
MFSRTNIEKQLLKFRSKRVGEQSVMKEVQRIFSENEKQRDVIILSLSEESSEIINYFNFDLLETQHIFRIDDIEKLCINYRLRFLDSHYFKGDFPDEAISEVRNLENKHQITLKNFKIIAPAKLMKLENADDPLLFAPMGNDYFYLIHKWGTDLHPLRKLLMWPYKSLDNLVFIVAVLSVMLTSITPMSWFTPHPGIGEYIFLAFYIFIAMGGMVILYGFSKGKNFNGAIWKSKYYNA